VLNPALGLFGGHNHGGMKSGVSRESKATVSCARCAGALSCWNMKYPPDITVISEWPFAVQLIINANADLYKDAAQEEFVKCNSIYQPVKPMLLSPPRWCWDVLFHPGCMLNM